MDCKCNWKITERFCTSCFLLSKDMNEPSNFDETSWYKCPADKYAISYRKCFLLLGKAVFVYLLFLPTWAAQMKFGERINTKTVCMNAVQGEHGEFRHYDVHSLYGWSETKPTLEWVFVDLWPTCMLTFSVYSLPVNHSGLHEATGKRGFVVSRSTYPSSGRYGAHWLGDNNSSWEQLRQSIIGMLEFSLFGMSFVGADICGFGGEAHAELCKRWLVLGAYYPFSRSHNTIGAPDQDPAVWAEKGHPEVTEAARLALRTRYQLLHYLYTRFYQSHVHGETLVRWVLPNFYRKSVFSN